MFRIGWRKAGQISAAMLILAGTFAAPATVGLAQTSPVSQTDEPAAGEAQTSRSTEHSVCVICEAPQQTYRCQLLDRAGKPLRRAAFSCLQRIARDGEHGSCSVRRGSDVACNGLATVVIHDGDTSATGSAARGRPAASAQTLGSGENLNAEASAAADALERRQAANDDGAPQTLEEAAGIAAENTRETLARTRDVVRDAAETTRDTTVRLGEQVTDTVVDAGKSVGGAARTAFDCVVTLFQDCD